ncbi:hypothetical protein DGG96_16010 [Legionella qingyii]|uniref:Uncharacterized protein n=1 Tax=Legionella qingyii TaxID=2184757 RepID=A0A317U1I8_9GAMM|nr:hypothetical protein [Legionella qingyii]PWY54657.1 hypothetical protein DGG96_16010 [Legionella qingyii]RUR20494.1 hypothetical protein ELY20_14645 [Legionella qingyii]RUR22629.1 hypothetical protein ELY16_14520 [Legionella qingyii]
MKKLDLFPITRAMQAICPSVISDLKANWDETLSSYIKQVWQKPISCVSPLARQSRAKFYSALRLFFGSNYINFELAFSEFDRYPILQTGPHCQLYANEIDFNAILMSWMGSQLHQLNHMFILNSVTRTLQWSKQQGPGWLNLKQGVINLFALTPKQMSKLSVCSSYPRLTYCIDNFIRYLTQADSLEKKGIEKLLTTIDSNEYKGFIPAFTLSNRNLLTQCDHAQEVQPVILNDNFTSLLVAEHLRDPEGIIYQLIFSSKQRSKLNYLINLLMHEKSHLFLKQGTEFFWGVRDNKIRALRIVDNVFKEETTNLSKQLKIPLDPQSICEALINGQLIPNIFLSFLVLCLMPQIRVLGGTRQIAYLPLIQKIFGELLGPNVVDEQELLQEMLSNDLNAWGTNFIQDTSTPLEWLGRLSSGKELSSLSTYYLDKSVSEITQELAIFKEHPLWKHMI